MTKTLNQIIFFPPPKSEYFFQQHWESEYFFRKKTITTPPGLVISTLPVPDLATTIWTHDENGPVPLTVTAETLI